jgi:hypothetical protein
MPSDAGGWLALAGQAMLVLAGVIVVAALVLTLPRLFRVRRRALALSLQVEAARAEALGTLDELERRREEARQLVRPLRRLRRWVRHPLSVATMQSYRRRRRRSR